MTALSWAGGVGERQLQIRFPGLMNTGWCLVVLNLAPFPDNLFTATLPARTIQKK